MPLSLNGKTHGFLGSGPSFVTQPWMIKRLFQWFIFLYQTHPLYLQCKIPIFELLRYSTNFELSNKIKSLNNFEIGHWWFSVQFSGGPPVQIV